MNSIIVRRGALILQICIKSMPEFIYLSILIVELFLFQLISCQLTFLRICSNRQSCGWRPGLCGGATNHQSVTKECIKRFSLKFSFLYTFVFSVSVVFQIEIRKVHIVGFANFVMGDSICDSWDSRNLF